MPETPDLLVLVGLTGVGKSTTLRALQRARPDARLLPDRRALTDARLLPEAQRLEGGPSGPVTDRVERFRLTALYRRHHPDGMARVLHQLLQEANGADASLLFDGLRGPDEVRGAFARIPKARFLALRAGPERRIRRLATRGEAFDRTGTHRRDDAAHDADLAARLAMLHGAHEQFDPGALARWARTADVGEPELLRAIRIVVEESRHYDADAAEAYLRDAVPEAQRLLLDTEALAPDEVARRAAAWWAGHDVRSG